MKVYVTFSKQNKITNDIYILMARSMSSYYYNFFLNLFNVRIRSPLHVSRTFLNETTSSVLAWAILLQNVIGRLDNE